MALTTAQKATVKADIIASPDLTAIWNAQPNSDGADAIAQLYNLAASPTFIVWKNKVTVTEIGDNIVATELAGLTTADATRLQTVVMLSAGGVDPSLPDRRAFFDSIFSGASGAGTRAKLLILWKRSSTRFEKLLSTGTGSDASPATLGFVGPVAWPDILDARTS
jgi:hypothetical protein